TLDQLTCGGRHDGIDKIEFSHASRAVAGFLNCKEPEGMSSTPLVVVGGSIHRDGIAHLESEARVVVTGETTEPGMLSVARAANGILFIMKPRCSRSLMQACPNLKVVGRYGVGLDTVDLPAATELGIAVVHAPGSNSDSVAEHAMMLVLATVKNAVVID